MDDERRLRDPYPLPETEPEKAPDPAVENAVEQAVARAEAAETRRRWVNLAELVGIAGLAIAALSHG